MKVGDGDKPLGRMLSALVALVCGAGLVCAAQGPADSNPRMEDVLAVLRTISEMPHAILCDSGGFDVPRGGHLQGIQQATIDGRPFLVLSGSASAESYLALTALEGSTGRVAAIKPLLPRPFKHAGGFQVCGDFLAVGIEDDNTKMTSRVWILRLAELLQAAGTKPLVKIERTGAYQRATAGAVAMAKVRDRHLLCVGTWDSATIDIYLSNATRLDDPACAFAFRETWDARSADRSDWSDRDYASYQNVNLVVDRSDCVFLVGFAHTGGADVMDVFELRMGTVVPVEKRLRKVLRRALHGRETSFRHGSGLAIADANTVAVLACGYQEFVIECFGPERDAASSDTEHMNRP